MRTAQNSNGGGASRIAEISGVGVKTLIIAGTAGAGGVLGLAVMELVHSAPLTVLGIFREWGPLAFILLVGMYVADRRMGENNKVQRETASSMRQLADAVTLISQKDDERARELELAVGVMARDTREVLERVKAIEKGAHGNPAS